jgi:hypothetical protein
MYCRSYKFLLALLLLLAAYASPVHSQDLTGIWRGYFVTDVGEKYKLEFQINGTSPNFSSGVSYSYLDVRFYGKATMTGNYSKVAKNLKIREIKTVEVKNLGGDGACIMNYDLFYSKSGKNETLEGTFLGKPEVKGKTNPYSWGDCGGGKVYLTKVTTTDFHLEPFLKNPNRKIIVNQPPVKKDSVKARPVTTPVKKPVVVNKPPEKKPVVANKQPVNKPVVKKNTTEKDKVPVTTTKPKTDTTKIKTTPSPVIKTNPIAVTPKPAVLKNRQNELMKSLTVNNTQVTVKLYDNGEIDDDTISVYLDNKLVLSSKRLTTSPLTVKFDINDENADHELVMVAENLGRIPPNTSLMIVECGDQRFEVRITSTTQKNAVVRFHYQKPK